MLDAVRQSGLSACPPPRRHAALAFAALSFGATSSVAREARAEDPAIVEAQQRFKEGLDLADAGNHEAARLKFQQAWSVFKSPAVLFNLARAEQLTGRDLEAYDHYRQFLRSGDDPKVGDAQREKARQHVAELEAKLGHIAIEAPPAARVTVDGRPVDDLQQTFTVVPGRHVVEGTFNGQTTSTAVETAAGATTTATLAFDPGGSGDGYQPPSGREEGGPAKWIVAGGLGVAGLAGLGIGVGFGLSSQSSKSEAEDLRRDNPGLCAESVSPLCGRYDAARDDAKAAATASTVGYVAGGVLLAGAVATVLFWPSSSSSSSSSKTATSARPTTTRVTPAVGGGNFGFALSGDF
jgi:hypothetical protein